MKNISEKNFDIIKNTELLTKYCIKLYGQQKTKELLTAYKNNLFDNKGLAYIIGSQSLEFFCMYFLQDVYTGDDKAPLAPIHYELWEEIQNAILNTNGTKYEYILPRGTGKTTCITLPTAIWCALYNYKIYTVISSSIGATAEQFIANIKIALEDNIYIEKSFGNIINKKLRYNNEMIELDTKPLRTLIQSIPCASSFRGRSYNNRRIELALLDDFQNESELTSDKAKEDKWKRFSDDMRYALQKSNNHMFALGTLQMKGDFYDRLRQQPTCKVRIEKGLLVDDVDILFSAGLWKEFRSILMDTKNKYALDDAKEFYLQHNENMKLPLLWSEYWDSLDVALSYYENPASFKQEFQNDIEHIGEKVFKSIVTRTTAEIESEDFIKTILSIDPASSDRVSTKHDYYAFCVLSENYNSLKFARKSIIKDFELDDYINLTIQLLKDYPDITHLSIEKNVYSGADVSKLKEKIQRDPDLIGRDITIINKHRTKNKDNRISAIVGDVNMGRIIFNEEDTAAIEQLFEFCGAKYSLHDDFPDCLADAVENIANVETVGKMKVFPLDYIGL